MSINKAHSNVFNCACLSENLAHHFSFHFSLRGSPVPENTDNAKEANSLWEHDSAPHTEIFPSVTWHNSLCDLLIQDTNKSEGPGPIIARGILKPSQ